MNFGELPRKNMLSLRYSSDNLSNNLVHAYLLILMWDIRRNVISPPFTILSDHLSLPHSLTHIEQFGYNISSPYSLGTTL